MAEDEHAGIRSGGSADPDTPGPGSGIAPVVTQLTGSLQTAANDAVEGLEQFANSAFDAGEAGIKDVLQVVDAAQTGVSAALSAVTAKATGGEAPTIPTIPTADIATGLTGQAQSAANRALNAIEQFANEAFDVGEHAIEEALKVVDDLQTRVSTLLSRATNIAGGKLDGPPKG